MGDANSDVEKYEEIERLRKIIPENHANRLKELFPYIEEYRKKSADLVKLGYKIEPGSESLKIWKEI